MGQRTISPSGKESAILNVFPQSRHLTIATNPNSQQYSLFIAGATYTIRQKNPVSTLILIETPKTCLYRRHELAMAKNNVEDKCGFLVHKP
jgi:hypothetical protein